MALSGELLDNIEKIAKAARVPEDFALIQKQLKILAKAILELNRSQGDLENRLTALIRSTRS